MNEPFAPTSFFAAQRMANEQWGLGVEYGLEVGRAEAKEEIEQKIRDIFADVLFEKPSQEALIRRIVFHFERIGMNVAPLEEV